MGDVMTMYAHVCLCVCDINMLLLGDPGTAKSQVRDNRRVYAHMHVHVLSLCACVCLFTLSSSFFLLAPVVILT